MGNPTTHPPVAMGREAFEFLKTLISTPSPSGFEGPVAKLYRNKVENFAHRVTTDVLGNVTAMLNPDAETRIMYAGHMDEIGFIVHHIDADGFLFFNTIGGTDVATEIGQRVWVHGRDRVSGTIGRKAIQTFAPSDSAQTPSLSDLWIDIGASSKADAEAVVSIGSPVTLQSEFGLLLGNRAIGRAFDNKAGLFIGAEVVRRLSEEGGLHPGVALFALGTVQEEIGSRGAQTAAFNVAPHIALAVDMGVATDYPQASPTQPGRLDLGKGPGISQGPSTNSGVFKMLSDAAIEEHLPHQLLANGNQSPTDARLMQTARGGVATGLLSVPLRYMHTPSEILCMDDVEATIRLVCAFCRRVRPNIDLAPW